MSKRYDILTEIQTRLKTLATFGNAIYIGMTNRISGKANIYITVLDAENKDDETNELSIVLSVFHSGSSPEIALENILDDEVKIIQVIENDKILGGKCFWIKWKNTKWTIDIKTLYINGMDVEFAIGLINY